MQRYFIYLSYNGKNYCGWQIQPNGITVQEKLQEALSVLLRQTIDVTGAGRTDSGVHARCMTAHFDCDYGFDTGILAGKLNKFLPPDIVIDRIIPVSGNAHARFDALSRTYKYYICHKKDPFCQELTYYIPTPLDYDKMNEAAQTLFDYTDFTSFSKLHTDVKTNNCKIIHALWTSDNNNRYTFTITADRFLRNMVRAIVGTLIDTGRGKLSIADFRKIIESKDRGKAGTSAPAHALFLWDIGYPENLFPK